MAYCKATADTKPIERKIRKEGRIRKVTRAVGW